MDVFMPLFAKILRYLPEFAALTGYAGGERKRKARRRLSYALMYRDAELVTFRRGHHLWTAFVNDCVTREIWCEGHFQMDVASPLHQWLEQNSPRYVGERKIVINVGANIGATALVLSELTCKKILAIEPIPTTYEILRQNVQQNDMGSLIMLENSAVSTFDGKMTMSLIDDSGQAEFCRENDSHAKVVRSRPLINILESHGIAPDDVGFVWSDTQGAEADVLETGAALWLGGTCCWMEFCPDLLKKQNAYERFIGAALRHFRSFIARESFNAGDAAIYGEPILNLEILGRKLEESGQHHTDVLLIPKVEQ